jgi:alpha-galactosidase
MRPIYGVIFILLLLCTSTKAQTMLLLPTAKFTTENNIDFAKPDYIDSNWTTIKTGLNWEYQGFENYNGYAWYRMPFHINDRMLEKSVWKDSIKINLGCIDDCAEIYLNGQLINKSGSFPDEKEGYITTWNVAQEIHLSVDDPLLNWTGSNMLAIKVYDGGGGGGLFKNSAYVKIIDILDKVSVQMEKSSNDKIKIKITNKNTESVNGLLQIINLKKGAKLVYTIKEPKLLKANTSTEYIVEDNAINNAKKILVSFIEQTNQNEITYMFHIPYILTPQPKKEPVINTPNAYGVRPNHTVIYRIPVSGDRPMEFSISNLPKGLLLHKTKGIITGSMDKEQKLELHITAKNKFGNATKTMLLQCGSTIALTPPMGWNSWNCWGLSVNEEKVKASTQAMIDKGLVNYGWSYINIDDGWEAATRASDGSIQTNTKFPNMKRLGDWIHEQGLKFGIYSSPGNKTCGDFLGSYQHELQDANTYNEWGVDYLKYDWCSYNEVFKQEEDTSLAAYKKPYLVMQAALQKQPRDIVYSLCQYGMKNVWEWGATVGGNCWRTTGDIEDTWESLYGIGFSQTKQQAYAKPGNWNDADMMIVGNIGWGENLHGTKLTPDEQYTHVSLWSLLNNPLLIGCDMSSMDAFTINLLTNNEVIAINQNTFATPATPIDAKNKQTQIWIKQLSAKEYAIGLFNITNKEATITIKWNALGFKNNPSVRDAWRQKDEGVFDKNYSVEVPAHGVKLIVCTFL